MIAASVISFSTIMIPPRLPSNVTYTSCWCEENIYLLCQDFVQNHRSLRDLWEIFVIFISNSNKTVSDSMNTILEPGHLTCSLFLCGCFVKVALWYQKAARFEGDPVVWDYHVVLLLRPRQTVEESAKFNENDGTISWVYDFDTTLPVPCPGQGKSCSFLCRGWSPK